MSNRLTEPELVASGRYRVAHSDLRRTAERDARDRARDQPDRPRRRAAYRLLLLVGDDRGAQPRQDLPGQLPGVPGKREDVHSRPSRRRHPDHHGGDPLPLRLRLPRHGRQHPAGQCLLPPRNGPRALPALCESLVLPLCVLLAVPLATAGAFCTLVWAGQTLNLFSLIGLLMLIGLVSKNAILLVDRAEHLRREGLSAKEAVVTAARHRLRPILMTTITVVIAMLPIALVSSAGSEDRTPMALVLVGGMTSSTLLTLVVVPTLYTYLDAIRRHLPPTPCARRGRLRALVRGDGARTPPHPVPAPK
jgi:hypothetical protein